MLQDERRTTACRVVVQTDTIVEPLTPVRHDGPVVIEYLVSHVAVVNES